MTQVNEIKVNFSIDLSEIEAAMASAREKLNCLIAADLSLAAARTGLDQAVAARDQLEKEYVQELNKLLLTVGRIDGYGVVSTTREADGSDTMVIGPVRGSVYHHPGVTLLAVAR